MIPGQFAYHRPRTLAEATTLLSEFKSDARVIAGGQSLIPMMKLRLAQPGHLVDLQTVPELKLVLVDGDVHGAVRRDTLSIGAMVTQAEVIKNADWAKSLPILREAALQIADPQVRSLGTIGGNAANGDPGNDMPAVLMCLDASYHLLGPAGGRMVKAREFYFGAYATALADGEILTAVKIPTPPAGHGWAYEKLKRKIGDYATAAAAVIMTVKGGKVESCSIALTNLSDRPLLASAAAAAVLGTSLDKAALASAVAAARGIMYPANDTRGTLEYRVAVGGTMVERALKSAFARAKG